jgi:hypothetical protein
MEIDVTYFVTECDPFDFSASVAERGRDAAKETWAAALAAATARPLLETDAEREAARAYFKGYGAWDAAEIAAWTPEHLDALVIQEAASAVRELQACAPGDGIGDIDWEEAERAASGRVCCVDGAILLYLGD